MRLKNISNNGGRFILLDLDKPWQLAKTIGLKPNDPTSIASLSRLIQPAAQILTEAVTGVVLGPVVGYEALSLKQPQTGLILSLDNNFYTPDPTSLPRFLSDWGVEHIRHNYGVVKLTLFYSQKEKLASEKKKLLAEIYDYAQYEQVDLVVELKVVLDRQLKSKEKEEAFLTTQLTAVRELQNMVDLFILEFPRTPLAVATLTAELDVPWLMNDHSTDYDQLKDHLRMSLEGGAVGMMFGPTIFQSAPLLDGEVDEVYLKSWQRFISTTARDRVLELSRIIQESSTTEFI